MMKLRKSIISIFGIAAVALLACSVKHLGDFKSLLNQGPMPLSAENAYLGSNLFIARQAESSAYLYNFLKSRGGPSAIELLKTRSYELEVRMYYGPDKEMYIGRVNEKSDLPGYEWIIRGPYAVERFRAKTLRNLKELPSHEPIFELWGKKMRFKEQILPDREEILRPSFVPTPLPTPKPKRPVHKVTAGPTPTPGITNPSNFDQQVLSERGELAPRDAAGDIVHTVKSNKETLGDVARWYTGSAEAGPEIAKKNNLDGDKPLTAGAKIIIPANKVTNPKIMK